MLLGNIAGLFFSASRRRPSDGTADGLWQFVLLGLALGPYVIFFAIVRALMLI